MCGRIVLVGAPKDIADVFELDQVPLLTPGFNMSPGRAIASILAGQGDRTRLLRMLSWGLVPPGKRNVGTAPRLINARAETISRKATFAESFARRRCLIPVNGFYEWKKAAGRTQPFLIRRTDHGLFALAGIWKRWEYPGGKVLEACAIITTEAAEFMQPVHHRMPVVITPEHWQTWLTTPEAHAADCEKLLHPEPADLIAHPVDPRVGNPDFAGPECLKPWTAGHHGQLDLFPGQMPGIPDSEKDQDND